MTDTNYENRFLSALQILPINIRTKLFKALKPYVGTVQEIVLRSNRPVCIYLKEGQRCLTKSCVLTTSAVGNGLVVSTLQDVTDAFNNACGYSVYSHLNEIKNGYITIRGGHRVGISGTAVVNSGAVSNIRDISTLSIRLAREVKGCADKLTASLVNNSGGILVCGSPSSGKTTLIRDIARSLSASYLRKVSVVDSRGELASMHAGVCQNDLGLCDVLDGYPRDLGIEHAIRCLSPEFIVCDEIGSSADVEAITSGVNSGVRFVATMHAATIDELTKRSYVKDIFKTDAFSRIVMLCGKDKPTQVYKEYSKEVIQSV